MLVADIAMYPRRRFVLSMSQKATVPPADRPKSFSSCVNNSQTDENSKSSTATNLPTRAGVQIVDHDWISYARAVRIWAEYMQGKFDHALFRPIGYCSLAYRVRSTSGLGVLERLW